MANVSTREMEIMTTSVIFVLGARIVCKNCHYTHGCVKGNVVKNCDDCKEIKGMWKCVPNAVSPSEIYQSCGCEKKEINNVNERP